MPVIRSAKHRMALLPPYKLVYRPGARAVGYGRSTTSNAIPSRSTISPRNEPDRFRGAKGGAPPLGVAFPYMVPEGDYFLTRPAPRPRSTADPRAACLRGRIPRCRRLLSAALRARGVGRVCNAAARGPGGKPGGYVMVGTTTMSSSPSEAWCSAPHGALTFTCLDCYRSTVDARAGRGRHRAARRRVPRSLSRCAGGDEARLRRTSVEGVTAPYVLRAEVGELGRQKSVLHCTFASRCRRGTGGETYHHATNEDAPVGLGAPVVLSRVEGRAPRHGGVRVLRRGAASGIGTRCSPAEPMQGRAGCRLDAKTGSCSEQGRSPGQLTGSFVRRFFRSRLLPARRRAFALGQGSTRLRPSGRGTGGEPRGTRVRDRRRRVEPLSIAGALADRFRRRLQHRIDPRAPTPSQVIAERFAKEMKCMPRTMLSSWSGSRTHTCPGERGARTLRRCA